MKKQKFRLVVEGEVSLEGPVEAKKLAKAIAKEWFLVAGEGSLPVGVGPEYDHNTYVACRYGKFNVRVKEVK